MIVYGFDLIYRKDDSSESATVTMIVVHFAGELFHFTLWDKTDPR